MPPVLDSSGHELVPLEIAARAANSGVAFQAVVKLVVVILEGGPINLFAPMLITVRLKRLNAERSVRLILGYVLPIVIRKLKPTLQYVRILRV
jgi:hypothetical protein